MTSKNPSPSGLRQAAAGAGRVLLAVCLLAGCATPSSGAEATPRASSSSTPSATAERDPADLVAGDCFVARPQDPGPVVVVPCEVPHGGETFAVVPLADGPWPGEAEVWTSAWSACVPAFEEFTGVAYAEPVAVLRPAPPTRDAWAAGRRDVLCHLEPGRDVVGSLRGRGGELVASVTR